MTPLCAAEGCSSPQELDKSRPKGGNLFSISIKSHIIKMKNNIVFFSTVNKRLVFLLICLSTRGCQKLCGRKLLQSEYLLDRNNPNQFKFHKYFQHIQQNHQTILHLLTYLVSILLCFKLCRALSRHMWFGFMSFKKICIDAKFGAVQCRSVKRFVLVWVFY